MSNRRKSENLINEKRRRLELLEIQAGRQGYNTDPKVLMEIEDIRTAIVQLESELSNSSDPVNSDGEHKQLSFGRSAIAVISVIILIILLIGASIWYIRFRSPIQAAACGNPYSLTKLALDPDPYDQAYASVHSAHNSTDFSITLNTSGHTQEAGVMWHFTKPFDLSSYDHLEVTLNLEDPIPVIFVLTDDTDTNNKPRLGAGVSSLASVIKIEANGQDQIVSLPLTQFHTDDGNVTRGYLKSIKGIGIDVLERNWHGEHTFTVKNIRFCQ